MSKYSFSMFKTGSIQPKHFILHKKFKNWSKTLSPEMPQMFAL